MIIKARRQFKEDYQKLIESRRNTTAFRRAFNKAIFLLQSNRDLYKSFSGNRLVTRGDGWFDCYITSDIVMIYKVEGRYVKLIAIGPSKEMYDR